MKIFTAVFLMVLLLLPVSAMALNGEAFIDAALTDEGNSDVKVDTTYTFSGKLWQDTDYGKAYVSATADLDSAGFDVLSRKYIVGVEVPVYEGLIGRVSYSVEKFRDRTHENLYKVGVGYRF